MKYLKSSAWILIPLFLLSFLGSFLYYRDWISPKVFSILKLLFPLLSFFIGGLYLGKHSKEKGWLEGLKLGSVAILLFFLLSYLGFQEGIQLKALLYYMIILITTIFGSMMGIRNVVKEN